MIGFISAFPLVAMLFGSSPDEIDSLRRKAVVFLETGEPAKALTLLKRARSTDTVQMDIDRQIQRCRIKLGKWVAPDADPGWMESLDRTSAPIEEPRALPVLETHRVESTCDSVVLAVSERWRRAADSLRANVQRDTVATVVPSEIQVIRYRLPADMNLRRVSKKFYGKFSLSAVLARWNTLEDSTAWRKLPVGLVIEIPFWKGFEYGTLTKAQAMSSIDWNTAPRPNRREP